MTGSTRLISTRQVLALLSAKLRGTVRLGKLERVVSALEKDDRLHGPEGREAWATPDDVDTIEGEVRRMYAGWYQRRNVRGDLEAWFSWAEGERYRVRIPWERAWSTERGEEVLSVPSVVGTWEWPTARLTGCMVRSEDVGEMPSYGWLSVEELGDDERALLWEQWLTGSRSHPQ